MGDPENDKGEIQFLSDQPVDGDDLGCRDKVANAIATTFSREEEGKAIALTGTWGSGKSSVVKMVKKIIANDNDQEPALAVIDFDAWCHKGDPLRCAFLMELGDRLSHKDVGWLPEEWWKGSKDREIVGISDQITGRRTVSHTKTTPLLSTGGRVLTVALLLYPVFLAMVTALPGSHRVGIVGLALAGVVFYVVGLAFLYEWRHAEIKDDKRQVRFFFEERETDTTTTEMRTPDPTSFEFRDYFNKILKKALCDGDKLIPNRKLMLVIDNLDRVDPRDAKTIWATMQTFLDEAGNSADKNDPRSRVWLLVPFDPDGIERIWDDENESEPEPGAGLPRKSETDTSIANSFKDKAFQITFHVSPPVLTNWKKYFIDQIKLALPNHEDDYHKLYRLYDQRPESDSGVTPRGLILFINRVVALHLQSGDVPVPLVLQGLYALEDEIGVDGSSVEERIKNLIKDPKPHILAIIDEKEHPDWGQSLAAVHYNVDPKLGLQMLYKAQIRDYLKSGSLDRLTELADVPGIPEVCEGIFETDAATYDIKTLAKAAHTITCLDATESEILPHLWSALSKGLVDASPVVGLENATGIGISAIVSHSPNGNNQDFLGAVVTKVKEILVPEGTEIADPILKDWLDGVISILESCNSKSPGGEWRKAFCVSNETFYVSLIIKLMTRGVPEDILTCFAPCDGKQGPIVAQLQGLVGNAGYRDEHANAVERMSKSWEGWPWEGLSQVLAGRLRDNAELDPAEFKACIRTLDFLAYDLLVQQANDELAGMAAQGQMLHWLFKASQSQDPKTTALTMFPILLSEPMGDVPVWNESGSGLEFYRAISSNPATSPEVVKELSDIAIQYKKIAPLVQKALASEAKGVVSTIINTASVNEDAYDLLPSDVLLENFESLAGVLLQENLDALAELLIKRDSLLTKIHDGGFKKEHSILYSAVFRVMHLPPGETKDQEKATAPEVVSFTDFLLKNLQAADIEVWSQAIKEPRGLINLLLEVVQAKEKPDFGTQFSEALMNCIRESMSAEEPSLNETVRVNGNLLLSAMDPETNDRFLTGLFDFAATSKKSVIQVLRAFDKHFLAQDFVIKEQRNYLHLFKNILERANVDEIEWFVEVLGTSKELLKLASVDMKRDFLEVLTSELQRENAPEGHRERVYGIGDLLGEDLRPPEPEQTEEEVIAEEQVGDEPPEVGEE